MRSRRGGLESQHTPTTPSPSVPPRPSSRAASRLSLAGSKACFSKPRLALRQEGMNLRSGSAFFPQQATVGLEPFRVDLSPLARRGDGAAGLGRMAAVAEAALPEPRPELDEGVLERGTVQVMQSEELHARRIDDVAPRVQVVEARVGGGVAPGIERG